MKKLVVAAVAVLSLTLVATAFAGSKTIRQSGGIVGDKAASVKLRIKVKNGEAIKVSGFKGNRIFTRCDGEVVRFKYTALDPLPVVNNVFNIKLVDGDAVLKIQGKVKNNGNKVNGNLKTNNFTAGNGATCKTPKQKFKTSS